MKKGTKGRDNMNSRDHGLSGATVLLWFVCWIGMFTCGGVSAQTTHTPLDWDAFQALKINPGDTVQFSATTYKVDGQVELVSNVTYQGDKRGGTVVDGGGAFRAFTAWGDRSLSDGRRNSSQNTTGPKGWVLRDMIIQNCVADKVNREFDVKTRTVNNPGSDDDGGAMNIDNGAIGMIQNCTFKNNKTLVDDGGAIAIDGAATVMTIEKCTFEGNMCDAKAPADDGGAIVLEGSEEGRKLGAQLTVKDSILKKNNCVNEGGVLRQNGAMTVVTFMNCIMDGNFTELGSGGVSQAGNSATTNFVNCLIINNKSGDNRIISISRGRILNCTFAGNDPTDHKIIDFRQKIDESSGITEYKGEVTNCLFIHNRADGAILDARDPVKFTAVATNNLFFGNVNSDGAPVANASANVTEVNSIRVNSGAATSIVANPATGDYHLVAGSPAIEAGTASGAPGNDIEGILRPQGAGFDIGAYEFSQAGGRSAK